MAHDAATQAGDSTPPTGVTPPSPTFNPRNSVAFPTLAAKGIASPESLPENFRLMRSDAATLEELPEGMLQQFIDEEEAGNLNNHGTASAFATAFPNVAKDLESQAAAREVRIVQAMSRAQQMPQTDNTWDRYQAGVQRSRDLEPVRTILGLPVDDAIHALQAFQATRGLGGLGAGVMHMLDFIQEIKEEFIFGTLAGQPGTKTTAQELTGLENEQLTTDDLSTILTGSTSPLTGLIMVAPRAAVNEAVEMFGDAFLGMAAYGTAKAGIAIARGRRTPAPIPAPATPPVPDFQTQLNTSIDLMKGTLRDLKLPREVREGLARAGIDEGSVTIASIIRGDVPNMPQAAFQSAKEHFLGVQAGPVHAASRRWLDNPNDLDAGMNFAQHMSVFARTNRATRPTEIVSGQVVEAAKVGNTSDINSIQQVIESALPGQDAGSLAYLVSLTRGNKERLKLVDMMTKKQGVLAGSATQVMLNVMIATLGVPIWNTMSMLGLEAITLRESRRAARIAGSQVVEGEAGAELSGMVGAYMQLLRGDTVMKERIMEDIRHIRKLFPTFDQGGFLGPAGERSADIGRFGEKLQIRKSISAENFQAAGFYGHALDAAGSVINIPTGVTATTDMLLRFAVRSGAMEAATLRQSTRIANNSLSQGRPLTRAELDTEINRLRSEMMANPDGTMIDMGDGISKSLTQIGLEKADYISLMTRARGRPGAFASVVSDSLVGRMLVPFPNVMIETASQGIRRLNPLLQSMQLLPSIRAGRPLTRAELDTEINRLRSEMMANPDGTMIDMGDGISKSLTQIGLEKADYISLMTRARGRPGAFASVVSDSLVGRMLVPFPNVMIETASQGIRRLNPLLQSMQLLPSIRADLAAGGAQKAKAMAQIGTARMLTMMGMIMGATGMITGSGPVNPKMKRIWQGPMLPGGKEHVREPNRFYIGTGADRLSIPLDRIGTIGNVLRFWADAGYVLNRLPRADELGRDGQRLFPDDRSLDDTAVGDLARQMIIATANVVSNPFMWEDLRDITGTAMGNDPKAFTRILERKVANFNPAGVLFSKDINKMLEDYRRIPEGDTMDRAWSRFLAMTPGMTLDGVPYHDAWGDVAEIPNGGMWEGIGTIAGIELQEFPRTDIRREIVDVFDAGRFGFEPPSSPISWSPLSAGPVSVNATVGLDTKERERYKELFGKLISLEGDNGLVTFRQATLEFIRQKDFKTLTNGPSGQKQALYNEKIVEPFKKAAKAQLIAEFPELQLALQTQYAINNGLDITATTTTSISDTTVLDGITVAGSN